MAYTATCPWGSTPQIHNYKSHIALLCIMLIVCLQMTKITMNVHLVSHLADYVQNWGPLWSYTCFVFESMNGHLKKLFHGTRDMTKQVCIIITIQLIGSNHRGGFHQVCDGRGFGKFLSLSPPPPLSLLIFPFGRGGGGIHPPYGLDEVLCTALCRKKIALLLETLLNVPTFELVYCLYSWK